jgi:protoporphyrinogen oxidase
MEHHENIIIGGGIAGLYLAYKLKQQKQNFILFEKTNRLGGRVKWTHFHGKEITLGPGVIREHDTNVLELVKELDLELNSNMSSYDMHPSIAANQNELDSMIDTIDKVYQTNKSQLHNLTFKQFLDLYLPAEFVLRFKQVVLHNDGWDADVHQTVKYYPLNEFVSKPSKIFYLKNGWSSLIETIIEKINEPNKLKISEAVIEIDWPNKLIKTNKRNYTANRLFICTNIEIKNIKLNIPKELLSTLDKINSIPYLRCYTYHPFEHGVESVIVPSILEKMIPMNDKILMSAYTDNINATEINEIFNSDNRENLSRINLLIKNTLIGSKYQYSIATDYVYQYWKHGVHYFEPFDKELIMSNDNVYLSCEMVANDQGWTNGALESVNQTLKSLN